MPVRSRSVRRRPLSLEQLFVLGWGMQGHGDEFRSEEHRRQCWEAHREELMAEHYPGGRPGGWWIYESQLEGKPRNWRTWLLEHRAYSPEEEEIVLEAIERDDLKCHQLAANWNLNSPLETFEHHLEERRRHADVPTDRPVLPAFTDLPPPSPEMVEAALKFRAMVQRQTEVLDARFQALADAREEREGN